jgi:hypothetical protein
MNAKATFTRLLNSARHLTPGEKVEQLIKFNALSGEEAQRKALEEFRRSLPQDKSFQTKVGKGPHTA